MKRENKLRQTTSAVLVSGEPVIDQRASASAHYSLRLREPSDLTSLHNIESYESPLDTQRSTSVILPSRVSVRGSDASAGQMDRAASLNNDVLPLIVDLIGLITF